MGEPQKHLFTYEQHALRCVRCKLTLSQTLERVSHLGASQIKPCEGPPAREAVFAQGSPTAGELIAALQTMPPDMPFRMATPYGPLEITRVRVVGDYIELEYKLPLGPVPA